MLDVGIASSLLQIWSSDLRGAVGALFLSAVWGLLRDRLRYSRIAEKRWVKRHVLPILGYGRVLGTVGLGVWFLWLCWWGPNLVANGSFDNGAKHWGSGYYEDLLRNGNWDTPERVENYKKAMHSFPYVLSLNVPRKERREAFMPDSTAELRPPPHGQSGKRAFRIAYRSDKAENQYGTLSQRIGRLEPNHPYVATFDVMAETYTERALFVTTRLDWRECAFVEIEALKQWRTVTCEFDTDDRDQVDLRFVLRKPAVVWIGNVTLRAR